MEAPNDDWSMASQEVVEVIVEYLKQQRRWRRDGPSLRSLNRHWCFALNTFIVEVRPHSSRVLYDRDIDSLSKFQNITTLDAIPFEGAGFAHTRNRCLKLVEPLSKLPRLRCLHVKEFLLHVEERDVQSLRSVKEVEIHGVRFVDHRVLSKISGMEIEKLAGRFSIDALNDFLPKIPSLRVLVMGERISGSVKGFYDFLPKTDALSVVSMTIPVDWFDVRLAEMHKLVALKIIDGIVDTLDPLSGLLKLTLLDFYISDGSILTGTCFRETSKRLVSVIIRNNHGSLLPNDFLNEAKALEDLSLYGCNFENGLIENLEQHSLKSLSLVNCASFDACFVPVFTSVTQLTLRTSSFPVIHWTSLQNLKSLTVEFSMRECAEFLNNAYHLDAVESLEMYCPSRGRSRGLRIERIRHLSNLRVLKLHGVGSGGLSITSVLKTLIELEELTIQGYVNLRSFSSAADCIESIKQTAPCLKFSSSIIGQEDEMHTSENFSGMDFSDDSD